MSQTLLNSSSQTHQRGQPPHIPLTIPNVFNESEPIFFCEKLNVNLIDDLLGFAGFSIVNEEVKKKLNQIKNKLSNGYMQTRYINSKSTPFGRKYGASGPSLQNLPKQVREYLTAGTYKDIV